MSHSPDDAQLTAYLLGELSQEETAQVEAQLAVSAALRDELAGLRQTVASLEAALAAQAPPAVPALDRQKLHSLLQSAVVTSHEPTVSAPALLASAPAQPARGGNSRGWLVAATLLVVGGLVGLSQWESNAYVKPPVAMQTKPGPMVIGPGPGVLVAATGASHEQEIALLVEEFNNFKQQGKYDKAHDVAQQALQLDPNSAVAVQMELNASFAMRAGQQSQSIRNYEESFYQSLQDVEASVAYIASHQGAGGRWGDDWSEIRSKRRNAVAVQEAAPIEMNLSNPVSLNELSSTSTSPEPGPSDPNNSHWFFKLQNGQNPSVRFGVYGNTSNLDGSNLSVITGKPIASRYLLEQNIGGLGAPQSDFGRVPRESTIDGLDVAPTDESLMMDLSSNLEGAVDESRLRQLSLQLSYEDLPKTPQLLTKESEKLSESELKSDSDKLAGIRALRLDQQSDRIRERGEERLDASARPQLTVADYESGLLQLGQAVRGWQQAQLNWDDGAWQVHSSSSEAKHPQDPSLQAGDQLVELQKTITERTTELQKLRESKPELAEKALAEVDPQAAKEAELALARVGRELQRQQQVWYYREGYVRQLEATIAAAEQYAHVPENDFVTPEAQPLSTFGIDVDTASYSNVRRFVESGQLPPPDAVRIEELINSFQYEGPKVEGEHPLAIAAEVSPCPWQPQHQLLRVALKGKSIDLQQRPPARLVFLVDTSGSMSDANKLPLVKQSLRILVEQMREQDRLSIVTYSDNAGLLLDSTGGDKREAILAAIDGLVSDGSTNGEAGLKLAYEVAVKQFGEGATNRVMLCTDGDFNVGESADSELVKLIEKQRQTGVFLNILGFGSGNLKDAKLEAIADKGNGQYIYIDGIKEARKTLLNELTGTLYTIAKDVKLQLEFNPNLVGSYRLVGYENRAMAAKDFSNDKVDSGDMGAGRSVVALYEIVPPGAPQPVAPKPETEPLKYQRAGSVSARSEKPAAADKPAQAVDVEAETPAPPADPVADAAPAAEAPKPADPLATELCTIRVRYKQPTSNESTKIETVVTPPTILGKPLTPISRDHVWATAVAQFGLLTRHSTFVGTGNYSQVLELAQSAIGDDPTGQRREFVTLVRQTQSLSFERERQLAEISRRAEEHRRVVEEIKTVEKAPDVMTKASCSGKYRTLLRRIEVADDQPTYGEFKDYGRWEGVTYKSHNNLPHGYWVYVAPHWYIWGESTERAAVDTTK